MPFIGREPAVVSREKPTGPPIFYPTCSDWACDDEGCYCPDDVFWRRLLGDDDPGAPGKDWAAAAFGED